MFINSLHRFLSVILLSGQRPLSPSLPIQTHMKTRISIIVVLIVVTVFIAGVSFEKMKSRGRVVYNDVNGNLYVPMKVGQAKMLFTKDKDVEALPSLKVLDGAMHWPILVKYIGYFDVSGMTVYKYSMPDRIFAGGWHRFDQPVLDDEIVHFILRAPMPDRQKTNELTLSSRKP